MLDTPAVVQKLSSVDAPDFAYTGDKVPAATPAEPTLGAILIATIVRPLPPRIASLLTASYLADRSFGSPPTCVTGGNVMIKGLEFGVREAGINNHTTAVAPSLPSLKFPL